MRPAELVRRAEEDIAAEVRDVERLVRRVVDGVDPGERAGLAGKAADTPRVGDRPGRVGGERERDDARPLGQLALEVVVVDGEAVGGVDGPNGQPPVGGQLDPGRDAAVVVERGREDLVARREVAPGCAGDREVERRHVHAEGDVVAAAAEEAARVGLRAGEDRLHRPAGRVRGAEVPGGLAQRPGDRLADLVRHLRAAGRVEEGEPGAEGGEARPRRLDVEDGRRHGLDRAGLRAPGSLLVASSAGLRLTAAVSRPGGVAAAGGVAQRAVRITRSRPGGCRRAPAAARSSGRSAGRRSGSAARRSGWRRGGSPRRTRRGRASGSSAPSAISP